MDHLEALGVLGLAPGVDWGDVRTAYRGLMLQHHPDHAGVEATSRAARITEAYAVLAATWQDSPSREARRSNGAARQAPPPPPAPPAPPGPATAPPSPHGTAEPWTGSAVEVVGGDTIALDSDAETAFFMLLDAAHDVGEVSFVDPSIGLVETVFKFTGTPACSLVVSLQGRQDHVEAFCTIEALDGSSTPPVAAVVEVFADLVRQRLGAALDRPVRAPAEWLVDEQGRPGTAEGQRPTGMP